VNASWSYLYQPSINQAVDDLQNSYNITSAVAAGNATPPAQPDNTFWWSPAGCSYCIVLGGLNQGSDTRWAYSNYRVTFYAPAQWVEAASTTNQAIVPALGHDWFRSELGDCYNGAAPDGCTSGTSFAAPLAAGLIARYLQSNPSATQWQIRAYLSAQSTAHVNVSVPEPGGSSAPILNMVDCQ